MKADILYATYDALATFGRNYALDNGFDDATAQYIYDVLNDPDGLYVQNALECIQRTVLDIAEIERNHG